MTSTECTSCRKPKATHVCDVCEEAVCKNCLHHLDLATFSFLKTIPAELKHNKYCDGCYGELVVPALDSYNEVMERAKGAFVFFKTQRKEIPLIKKSKLTYRVPECPDRDETILRLAFFAAEEGYNAVIEVEATSEKVRNGAYQTSKWRGEGVGATVDSDRIDRQDLQNMMYR